MPDYNTLEKLLTMDGLALSGRDFDASSLYPVWESSIEEAKAKIASLTVGDFTRHADWLAVILFDDRVTFKLSGKDWDFLRGITAAGSMAETPSAALADNTRRNGKKAEESAKKKAIDSARQGYVDGFEVDDSDPSLDVPDSDIMAFLGLSPDEMMALWFRFRWNMLGALDDEPDHLWGGDMKYTAERFQKGLAAVWVTFNNERIALAGEKLEFPVKVTFPDEVRLDANWDRAFVVSATGVKTSHSFKSTAEKNWWTQDERRATVAALLATVR